MTDYIKRAVELANEWNMSGDFVATPLEDIDLFHVNNLPPMQLDALAAQLVRQVDATEKYVAHQFEDYVEVSENPGLMQYNHVAESLGPDRTMNTIKAIIDSGVLSE